MEKEKQKEEQEVQEFVKIGELFIGSSTLNTIQLSELAVSLLQNKEVKIYLDLIKSKKNSGIGSYTG